MWRRPFLRRADRAIRAIGGVRPFSTSVREQRFDGFIACVRTKEEDLANALVTLGEDGSRRFYSWYDGLPDEAMTR